MQFPIILINLQSQRDVQDSHYRHLYLTLFSYYGLNDILKTLIFTLQRLTDHSLTFPV